MKPHMPLPSWLLASPHADVLESLRRLAWADGVLSPSERVQVSKLVGRLGLAPNDEELAAWLGHQPESSGEIPDVEGSFERRFLLSEAIRLAYEDGDYSEVERAHVLGWAQAWGLTPAEVKGLEEEVLAERNSRDPFRA